MVPFYRIAEAGVIWTVDGDGSADFLTIQEAVNNASSGDTIFVRSGTYFEHVVVDKSLLVIGEDQERTIIDGSGDGFPVIISGSGVTLRNFTIQHGVVGVIVDKASEGNVVIENKIVFNSFYGLYGDRSGQSVIASNNVSFNGAHGIFLYASKSSEIVDNSIMHNLGDGILLRYHANGLIRRNFVQGNRWCGIFIASDEDPERPSRLSKNNVIAENQVLNNLDGIMIRHIGTVELAAQNEVYNNTVAYNSVGLNLSGSNSNRVFNNNFVNNSMQLSLFKSSNNSWDGGYYVGGNFWSDHECSDLYSGPLQNEDGGDGIGDVAYEVSAETTQEDRYPFMHQNGWQMNPIVSIVSPANEILRSNNLPLILRTNKPVWLTYSLDDQPNQTVVKDTVLADLQVGMHFLKVFAADASANKASAMVTFTITFYADLNLDGIIDEFDLQVIANAFGSSIGGERWNSDADLDLNGHINILDFAIVAIQFGNTIW